MGGLIDIVQDGTVTGTVAIFGLVLDFGFLTETQGRQGNYCYDICSITHHLKLQQNWQSILAS